MALHQLLHKKKVSLIIDGYLNLFERPILNELSS